jgi:WXXGXW repeat (2 copies)
MKLTSVILGTVVSLTLAAPMASAAVVYIAPREPPPEVIVERPGPRPGYVWVGGRYEWRERRYVWHHGHYARERHGWAWHEGGWERRGDYYRWHRGGWRR